jgi:hypothetical protein
MSRDELQRVDDGRLVHRRDGLGQRQMGGQQRHLHIGGQKGHQIVPAVALEATSGGQIVGVAAEVGLVVLRDRGLADRPGDEGVDLARARHGDG